MSKNWANRKEICGKGWERRQKSKHAKKSLEKKLSDSEHEKNSGVKKMKRKQKKEAHNRIGLNKTNG